MEIETNDEERQKIDEYCRLKGESYSSYDYNDIEMGKVSDYEIISKTGRGKYSEVYIGQCVDKEEKIILKVVKPLRKMKFARSVKILKNLTECKQIMNLIDIVKDTKSNTTALVLNYFNNNTLKSCLHEFDDLQIRRIVYQVLLGLKFAHERGIMHRDIKPANILINKENQQLEIIDWGVAEFYFPDKEHNLKICSRPYKSPEILCNFKKYNYQIDIWAIGCIMGAMIFSKDHLFMGKNNLDQLQKVIEFFGFTDFKAVVDKYQYKFDETEFPKLKKGKRKSFRKFINEANKHLCSDEALDLIKQLLKLDFQERILASQAIKHKYFDPIRNEFNQFQFFLYYF